MTIPKINASPTKEFFISILVRDVILTLAIADLVDNCVDGAIRERPSGDFKGLFAKIKFNSDFFSIEDNCGGIPADTAINYAFRFGRVPGTPKTSGSVGQFGVGMKRSLFKIGSYFNIVSYAATSDFILEVDVDEWSRKLDSNGKELWEFEFRELHQNVEHAPKDRGTSITITKLHPSIANDFSTENFTLRLIEDLKSKHQESLAKGLIIEVNGIQLAHEDATLVFSNYIKPIHIVRNFETKNRPTVRVEIFAGISKDSDPNESGWYVFCNGRLILRADKSRDTGWDEKFEDIPKIPKPHGQFARFRGYIRFTCEDADLLPWNTTKSALDTESPIYQAVKPDMFIAMRQVIDFLNKVDRETETDEKPLTNAIRSSQEAKLSQIPERNAFVFPTPREVPPKPKVRQISYPMKIERIDAAAGILGTSVLKEIGEATFNYFMRMEGGDEDAE